MIVRKTGQSVLSTLLFMVLGTSSGAIIGTAAPGYGQAGATAQKPLQHEVAVTVKLIQVYVTDKDGRPAMDLRPSDFRVFDNGQPVEITEFEVHSAEGTPARHAAAPAEPAAKEAKAEPAPATAATRMGRKFFFLFDHESNTFEGTAKARNAALHFLDTAILPDDEVGVLSFSKMGGGLVMHCFLTTDRAKAREAVLRVRGIPGAKSGGTGGADTSAAGGITVSSRRDSEGGGVVIVSKSGPSRPGFSSGGFLYAPKMADLARAMRYIPGTKNILYFSQGGPADPETSGRLVETSREFAAANAPLFTINTETPDPFNPKGTKGEPALALAAKLSGGKSYADIGTILRIPEVAADIQMLTRNYYVLGFPVRQTWDGKYHTLKIEIDRPEYRVQTQSGYYNPKPFGDYTDVEKELHLFDLVLSEKPAGKPPLLFPMRVLRFESGEEAGILLQAKIPPEVISAFAGREIEVVSLVLDGQDNPVGRYRIEPDLDKVRGREVVFTSEALLVPGDYRCRIVLRDLESGDAAMAYAAVTVPAPLSAGGLRLFSPLLLTSYRPALAWEEETKKGARRSAEIYAYDPAKYTLLAGDAPAGAKSIYAIVPYALGKLAHGAVTLRAALVDAAKGTRTEIPMIALTAKRNGDREAQLVECGLDGIPPAKYLLYIYGEEASTGAVSYAQTALTIR